MSLIEEDEFHRYFPHVTASGFLVGMLDILRSNFTQQEKEKLVIDHILFYTVGLFALFDKGTKTY